MWIWLFVAAMAWGQSPAGDEMCTVAGVVRNAATGAPLRKAMVRLGHPQGWNPRAMYMASTDEEGRFSMKEVKAGLYRMWAEKGGFVKREYGVTVVNRQGALLQLTKGKSISDMEFRLQPQGAIAGRVVDEDGEPLVATLVQALVLRQVQGTRELQMAGSAVTNDLGEYRIYGIPQGRYFVAVNRSGTGLLAQVERSSSAGDYPLTFYPGTVDWNGATAMPVTPGATMQGVDIQLRKAAMFRIRGRVTGLPTKSGGEVEAQLRGDVGMRVLVRKTAYWSAADGAFELSGLLPGTYVVGVRHWEPSQQVYLSAREVVVVPERDVDGVRLTPVKGVPIRGRLRIEGGGAVGWQSLSVVLFPREVVAGYSYAYASVGKDGEFELAEAGGDEHSISVRGAPEGYFVQSVRMGEIDVLRDGLQVVGGAVPGLDVVLSSKGAEVSGVAVNADGKPAGRATVLLHPLFGGARRVSDLQKMVETGADGKFRFHSVTPGEYRLYAFGADAPDGGDIDGLEEYEAQAAHLRLEESGRVASTVSVRSSR
ncbi:MAG: carboxypeptidase regulatory-like domain-containing protein [Acidobacteria bacterium]|nr:carboxypeptidase regulatory-like domain-containing protein [Acidobacteriota bacterium]